ncbi:MAG: hypothetical protein ACLP9L_00940 [Thermoguttaceae bacterium]
MHFVFYPKHQYRCPHVSHCPHLGGAALGTLVDVADEQTDWTDSLLRQIDSLRAESTTKSHKIEEQAVRIGQLERELKSERQKQFQCKKEEPAERGNKEQRGRESIYSISTPDPFSSTFPHDGSIPNA